MVPPTPPRLQTLFLCAALSVGLAVVSPAFAQEALTEGAPPEAAAAAEPIAAEGGTEPATAVSPVGQRTPGLAEELLRPPRREYLPMPLSRPMVVPQQEAPGVVVSEVRTDETGTTTAREPAAVSTALALGDPDALVIPEAMREAALERKSALNLSHYAYGAFQRGLYNTAFTVALRASANDEPAAAALIGRLYEEAKGVEQDLAKAVGWYAVAADLGSAVAQHRLAAMLLMGRGVPKDARKAAEVLERAAGKGNADAAHALAVMFIKGEGKERDLSTAFDYMKRAAMGGDIAAQHALALMYEDGQGTVPDDQAATRWFGKAAEQGDPSAALAYGQRVLEGRGAEASGAQAAPFLAMSARAGNPTGMNLYARVLADGNGVAADEVEAVKWHLLARASGVSDLYLDGFMGTRDQAVLEAAQQRVRRFLGR